ncbi:MAG TPA: 50S ribosomal protein L11 methyltransferase [Ignavibacteriaceae bacterium]|jgi:ribosomal protein L11 methyltransferase|nr:50S ribosomal protein L11 methyltransferase [Ignavibacteriaceae bacterium]
MKKYLKTVLKTEPLPIDILTGLLWNLNPSGIEEEDGKIIVYFENDDENHVKEVHEILNQIKESGIIERFNIDTEICEYKNWNEEWERSLNIIKVTENITIKPTFRDYTPAPGELVILIDPKMSFGTGEHQTTKLIIKLLERYVQKGIDVLDAGTGTGILAITAVKLGASHALGFDNDELCLINGEENVEINSLSSQIEIRLAEINQIEVKEFDLVIANIQKNVLLNIASEIHMRTKKNGVVILSGLLLDDEIDINNKYESIGFQFVEKLVMDEWISLVYRKL